MLPTTDGTSLVCTALYLALIFLVGYVMLCGLLKPGSRHWLQLLGHAYVAGGGVVSLLLFVISVCGFKPSRGNLAVIAIIAVMALTILLKKKNLLFPSVPARRHAFDALTLLAIFSSALIVAAAANIASNAAWPGLNDIDIFGIWAFKAKWVYLDSLRPMPAAFHDPGLSYAHQDYPLAMPFLLAGLYAFIGRIDEDAAKLLLLPTWMSLTAILYAGIRRFSRRAVALTVTAVFCTAPILTRNAAFLVAETSLILALAAAGTQLLAWMENGGGGELLLAGLFIAIAALTKNEGLALLPVFGLAALIFALSPGSEAGDENASLNADSLLFDPVASNQLPNRTRRKRLREWFLAVVLSFIFIAPWLIFRSFLPRTHEDYGNRLLSPAMFLRQLPQRVGVFPKFLAWFFSAGFLGLVWYLLLVTAVFALHGLKRRPIQLLWGILLCQLALYLATFVVTPWDVGELIPMITPKLQTQASPIAALLIALNLREMRWTRTA